jgi:hypothetical protein
LGIDEEPQDRDAERLEGFAVHINCGMDKKPESLSAREITGYYHSVHPVVVVVRLCAMFQCIIWVKT